MNSFNVGGRVVAEVSVRHLAGIRAVGSHLLLVQLDVIPANYKDNPTGTISNFGGFAEINSGGRVGELRPYGQRYPLRLPMQTPPSHMLQLLLDLGHERLDAIEEIRKDGQLVFTFCLTADADFGERLEVGEASVQYRINAGTWIEILGQMGYQDTLVIDVPFPKSAREGPIQEACLHLRESQGLFLGGSYREAVGKCRDVLEALARAIQEADSDEVPAQGKAATKDQRYGGIRAALRFLTHPARHADKDAATYTWTRADAQYCLAAAAAIVRRFLAER